MRRHNKHRYLVESRNIVWGSHRNGFCRNSLCEGLCSGGFSVIVEVCRSHKQGAKAWIGQKQSILLRAPGLTAAQAYMTIA